MKSRFLPLGVALALAVLIAFTVDNFVREVVIAPLLYTAWLLLLILRSLPTSIYWIIFVLAALIVAVRSFARPPRRPKGQGIRPLAGEGPLASWHHRLQRARQHNYSRWLLARDLRKLTGELLNPTDFFQLDQADSQRTNFETTLPPEIAALFQAKMETAPPISRLRSWLGFKAIQPSGDLGLDPGVVVTYLESQVTFQPNSSTPTLAEE